MKRSNEIAIEKDSMGTMVELTGAFEGIASIRIAQVRDQVLHSQQFFGDLWQIYSQIRVDEYFHFGRRQSSEKPIEKELMILITSEGGFSGDIDRRLIAAALGKYHPDKNAIIIVGSHGANQLTQLGVPYVKRFKTPDSDLKIHTEPLIREVKKYTSTVVFYERYKSLMSQDIREIRLSSAVMERGQQVERGKDVIDESNYIFEPSTYAVVDHLENSMMQIMLSEVLLESKLAQYASRFRAMSMARDRAAQALKDTSLVYNRARRQEKDERLKEIINGLRKSIT
ncbi:MAG TPA: FoF1 ATP synthase subunit gamma [Candidatus Saccharimonadales bacterium]|nr:FoF1 ATP synthase subunit gamma [Candidatus Saccharimonadales bacterium]